MGNVENFPVAIITKGNTVIMIIMIIAVEDEKKTQTNKVFRSCN